MDDARWLGADIDEDEARRRLVGKLMDCTRSIEQVIDRKRGDELRIVFDDGDAFVVRAPRLWLSWEPALPAMEGLRDGLVAAAGRTRRRRWWRRRV